MWLEFETHPISSQIFRRSGDAKPSVHSWFNSRAKAKVSDSEDIARSELANRLRCNQLNLTNYERSIKTENKLSIVPTDVSRDVLIHEEWTKAVGKLQAEYGVPIPFIWFIFP